MAEKQNRELDLQGALSCNSSKFNRNLINSHSSPHSAKIC